MLRLRLLLLLLLAAVTVMLVLVRLQHKCRRRHCRLHRVEHSTQPEHGSSGSRASFVCLFVYFIHQSTLRKRYNFTRKTQFKKTQKTVWIKWPTQGRAT